MCDCGCDGIQSTSTKGADGIDGMNNYELAVASGEFTGTLAQYLQSLHGAAGASAYDLWVAGGGTGSHDEFIASLVGPGGADGANGQSAYTHQAAFLPGATPQFVQPAVGQTVLVILDNADWLSLNMPVHLGGTPGNWYFVSAIQASFVLLRNPGAADGYPTGIASNAAPGTTIVDTFLTARGRDGKDGINGAVGPIGPVGPLGPGVGVVNLVPSTPPASGGAELVLVVDSPSAPTSVKYYNWSGTAWALAADVTPEQGSKILFLGGDPNSQPSTYGNNDDVCMDNSVAGTLKVWQRTAPGTWALKGSISGAGGMVLGDLFRVGKVRPQPILKGATTATVVQFEAQSGGDLFNGGAWNGSKYAALQNLSTPSVFRLEGVNIFTDEGAGEAVTFTVDIKVNGSSVTSGTIVMTSGTTEGKMALLAHSVSTMTTGDTVQVTITPSVNPTVQWNVESAGVVFYNQR